MIKCDKGNVSINGSDALVLSELSTIVHALYYDIFIDFKGMNAADAKSEIMNAVNDGFMTDDEAKSKAYALAAELRAEGFAEFLVTLGKIMKGREH